MFFGLCSKHLLLPPYLKEGTSVLAEGNVKISRKPLLVHILTKFWVIFVDFFFPTVSSSDLEFLILGEEKVI